jgi:hypothetical protein
VRSITQGGFVCFLASAVIGCSTPTLRSAESSTRTPMAPSADAIREFFTVIKLDDLLNEYLDLKLSSFDAKVQGMRPKGRVTPIQERVVSEFAEQARSVLSEELGVDHIQSILVDVFQQSFSEQDVDALTAFYRTKSGKAVIAELPSAIRLYANQNQAAADDPLLKSSLPSTFGLLFKPWENRDFAGVFSSDIGEDIRARLPAATKIFDEETEKLIDEIQTRLRQLVVEYQAKIKTAGT